MSVVLEEMEQIHQGFLDHEQFSHCLQVQDKSGQEIPYRLFPAQRKLVAAVNKQRAAGVPVRIVAEKGRQVRISTVVAGLFFHELGFKSGKHARVVAHMDDAAADIFDYYKTFNRTYQPYADTIAAAQLVKDAHGWIRWDNQSWCRIMTASKAGSGRSATVSLWHLSEFALYPHATALMRGIMGSVPKTPDTAVIVESTCNGIGNEFHQLCIKAQDPANDSGWEFVFCAWHEDPEYIIPIEGNRGLWEKTLDSEERVLQTRFQLSLEQLNWRRWTIKNEFSGDVDGFKQEYPCDWEEGFIASGRPRFSLKHVERMPVIDAAPCGGLEEDHYGPAKLLNFEERERGELTVYQRPVPKRLYAIGADTANGYDINEGVGSADPDYCSAIVLDIKSGEQVAKLRARYQPSEFGRQLVALARWYNYAFLVPEINNAGMATLDSLLEQEWPLALIYHRRANPKDPRGSQRRLPGHLTNGVTRPQLIAGLDEAIRTMSIWVRDPHTQQELRTFVIKPDGKAEHQTGCHDDDVFALALGVKGIQTFPHTYVRDNLLSQKEAPRVRRYGNYDDEDDEETPRRGTRRRLG